MNKIKNEKLVEFYKGTQDLYNLAPWKLCSDSDLFGVYVKETEELHFVSIMGAAGHCFGIATYRWIDGLDLFLATMDGLFEADPLLVQRRQDGLLLEFIQKEYLDSNDLELLKNSNFHPLSENSWVTIKEFSRGWAPWWPKEKDLVSLIEIFKVIPKFLQLQKKDSSWSTKKGRDIFPVFIESANAEGIKEWNLEWWNDAKIVKASEKRQPTIQVSNEHLAVAKTFTKDLGLIWEAYSFYASEPELDKGRPFFPEVCVIVNQNTGQCLGMEIIHPHQNRSEVLRDLCLKAINTEKTIPQVVIIEETELLTEMLILKEVLNLGFKVNAAKMARKFHSQMFENSQVRAFN